MGEEGLMVGQDASAPQSHQQQARPVEYDDRYGPAG